MQVGDCIRAEHTCGKSGPKWCRGRILEINNAVARVSLWTGKEFVTKPVMLKDLRKEEE